MNYLHSHWLGKQSLACSFWINLVGIRVLIFALQSVLAPAEGSDFRDHRMVILAGIVIFHIALLIWQMVGVVRSAERHFAENGNMALVWGAQLGTVLMLILSAVYALGAVQMSMPLPEPVDVLAGMDQEHASQYDISLSDDARTLTIDGRIELGITRALKTLLAKQTSIDTVLLVSDGGNIYEGRGLARLFADRSLNVHVTSTCASACTIAFVGGIKRSASEAARFGFHQYRMDADYTVIATDVEREQARDQQLFREAGIADNFVATVFSRPSESMWWPSPGELLEAGFLHEVVEN